MSEEKRTLPEEELPETSVLSDEQLSENARRNREILRKTATIERAILIALTIAFLIFSFHLYVYSRFVQKVTPIFVVSPNDKKRMLRL